ncbi:Hsp20/alpha crystallin family protein [Massilia sp. CF038]|uniref:Hsp20/alpha crystallin family protein n=1 Tax=Massilia sp. CF038 TaxID=1881045 RepID=UPI00091637EC|nr:Hsp20/alpha crystallin family protein [Massilia sp. CF038]SHH21040.1 Molecular chaperone IbpA, HSP20 family [Massilia sp. CF038]
MDTDKQSQAMGQGAEPAQAQQVGDGRMEGQGTGQQGAAAAGAAGTRNVGVLTPPVDVIEDAGGITLLADIPGVSRENLHLRLEAHSLTIEGALSLDIPQDMQSRYAEVRHQHYERTFALSRDLDGAQATAELAQGVLKIRIPKTQQAAPRKIPVSAAPR